MYIYFVVRYSSRSEIFYRVICWFNNSSDAIKERDRLNSSSDSFLYGIEKIKNGNV